VKIETLNDSSKKTAIIAADIHLLKKPGMWGRAEIAGDDIFALQQIVDIVKEYDADLYLLGDVLDSVTNLPRPLVVAQQLLEPLITAGHKVRYIQGQHEIVVQAHYNNYPWMSLVSGTEHMAERQFNFLGKHAYAFDYFSETFELERLAKIPENTEVLFMHGTAAEVFPMAAHFSLANIPQHVRTIFAGDYHVATEYKEDSGRILIYTGSTRLTACDESPDKSVIMASLTDEGLLQYQRLPLKSRTVVKYSELPKLILERGKLPEDTELPEQLRKPVILINQPIDRVEYVRLAEYSHLYSTSGASPNSSCEMIIEDVERQTDEEILARYVDREKYPEEFAFTLDIIQNPIDNALKRLRDKLGILDDDFNIKMPAAVAQTEETKINLE